MLYDRKALQECARYLEGLAKLFRGLPLLAAAWAVVMGFWAATRLYGTGQADLGDAAAVFFGSAVWVLAWIPASIVLPVIIRAASNLVLCAAEIESHLAASRGGPTPHAPEAVGSERG